MNYNMKILIVDDMQSMRRTIADILRSFGFKNFVYAEDGLSGWRQLLEERNIEIVLLDWNMPEMNGLDLLRKIRSSEKFAHLPVLMITAEAEQEQVLEAIHSGVTNYVVKPFTPNTLVRKLSDIIGRKNEAN